MMKQPKFKGVVIEYYKQTFDGTMVLGLMRKDDAMPLLEKAEEDDSIKGYELVSNGYHFESQEVMESKTKTKE